MIYALLSKSPYKSPLSDVIANNNPKECWGTGGGGGGVGREAKKEPCPQFEILVAYFGGGEGEQVGPQYEILVPFSGGVSA